MTAITKGPKSFRLHHCEHIIWGKGKSYWVGVSRWFHWIGHCWVPIVTTALSVTVWPQFAMQCKFWLGFWPQITSSCGETGAPV